MIGLIDKFFLKKPKLRRFVTKIIAGKNNKKVDLFGASLIINSTDEHGYLRSSRFVNASALLREELPVLFNLGSLLEKNDAFIDVGANIGIFSVVLSRLNNLGKNIEFYAYEANPKTYQRLKQNCLSLPIEAKNIAISNHSNELTFVEGAVSHVFTNIENKSEYSFSDKKVTVPCTSLDKQSIKSDSIILKIDVEGQEMEVLQGAEMLFSKKRIKAVFIDGFNDESLPSFMGNFGFKLLNAKTLLPYDGYSQQILAIKNKLRTDS